MDMSFLLLTDQDKKGFFDVQWHPDQEYFVDCFSKHFVGQHHVTVQPLYRLIDPFVPKNTSARAST